MSASQIAIVTGGSRGIGRACVEALLKAGWTVWFCARDPQGVDLAQDQMRRLYGDQVHGRAVDVGRQDQVDAFVQEVLEAEGQVDCLVNNAGFGYFAPVDEIPGDTWRALLDTNLNGPFYFTRAVAPAMRRRGSGFIFNVASLAGRHAFAGGSAYNAAKFGLTGFSEASMLDLRHDGVRVAAILPGSVDTEFHDAQGGGRNPTSRQAMLRPQDVARTVVDLLSYPERALPSLVELRPAQPKQP